MTCVHLKQLFSLCSSNQLKLSSSDVIHIVCEQCNKAEVCPSVLLDLDDDSDEDDDELGSKPPTAEARDAEQ